MIRFLNSWNGYDFGQTATLSGGEETRLIGLGIAENFVDHSFDYLASAGLPTQSGAAGKVLGTDGSTASWVVDQTGGSSNPYLLVAPLNLTTSATPTDATFVAFPSTACTKLVINNNVGAQNNASGADLEYQRNGAGGAIRIPYGASREIIGITNASQIAFRRADYATGATTGTAKTRTSTVRALAYSGGPTIGTVTATSATPTNAGAFTLFPSIACVALEVINVFNTKIRVNVAGSTSYILLNGNESLVINNITNANQVGILPDTQVVSTLTTYAECFSESKDKPLSTWIKAELINAGARIYNDDNYYPAAPPAGSFSTIGTMRDRPILNPKGRMVLATYKVASTILGGTAGQCSDVADGGEKLYGTTAMQYAQASGTANQTFRSPDVEQPTGVNVTNTSIRLRFSIPYNAGVNYSSTSSSFSALQIRLFSAGTPTALPADYHTVAVNRTDWSQSGTYASDIPIIHEISIPVSAATVTGTGADLTSVKFADLTITSSVNGVKIRLFDISAVPNSDTNGKIIFVADGLYVGQFTNLAPMLNKYGYPGCINMSTLQKAGSSGFMSVAQMQMLVNRFGWQVMHHSYANEAFYDLTAEQWVDRLSRQIVGCKSLGLGSVLDGAFGSGSVANITDEKIQAARRNLRSLHLFISGSGTIGTPPLPLGETSPPADPHRIKRMAMIGFPAGEFLARWKDHVDQAITNKGVAIFGIHSDFDSLATESAINFPALMDYIRVRELAGTAEVVTMNTYLNSVY